jgi:hypothetical protein
MPSVQWVRHDASLNGGRHGSPNKVFARRPVRPGRLGCTSWVHSCGADWPLMGKRNRDLSADMSDTGNLGGMPSGRSAPAASTEMSSSRRSAPRSREFGRTCPCEGRCGVVTWARAASRWAQPSPSKGA